MRFCSMGAVRDGVMMTEENLGCFIDGRTEEIIQFTRDLIATPSETPPGDERKIAKVIQNKFRRLGLEGFEVACEIPERPNLLYIVADLVVSSLIKSNFLLFSTP